MVEVKEKILDMSSAVRENQDSIIWLKFGEIVLEPSLHKVNTASCAEHLAGKSKIDVTLASLALIKTFK